MPHDVITIGAATRDVFLKSNAFQLIASDQFSTGLGGCVALGSKIDLDEIFISTGGGATNSAVTFANLGFNTGIVARLGQDDNALAVEQDLISRKIDTSLIKKIKGDTAYSTLLMAKNGERSILVYRGVSATFSKADIAASCFNAKALYITSLAGQLDVLNFILLKAKKNKQLVALNPGSGELKYPDRLLKMLSNVDLLLVNLEEAQKLLNLPKAKATEVVKKLSQYSSQFIITDGAKGAYALSAGVLWFVRPSGKKSVSRAGAGDAFGSATFAGLLKGLSIDKALQLGTLNAESVIQSVGAKTGILRAWPNAKMLSSISVRKLNV